MSAVWVRWWFEGSGGEVGPQLTREAGVSGKSVKERREH